MNMPCCNPECGALLPEGRRFCTECGAEQLVATEDAAPVAEPEAGRASERASSGGGAPAGRYLRTGDIVNDGTIIFSTAGETQLLECPICGRRNPEEQIFRCVRCRRDHLCLTHQDNELHCCADCAAGIRCEAESENDTDKKARPGLPFRGRGFVGWMLGAVAIVALLGGGCAWFYHSQSGTGNEVNNSDTDHDNKESKQQERIDAFRPGTVPQSVGMKTVKRGEKSQVNAVLPAPAPVPVPLPSIPLAPGFRDETTDMAFVLVPGGCFKMGDTFAEGDFDEKPVHEVCLDSFYMGSYEVTQGEYEAIMKKNPSCSSKGHRFPVEKVSWNDAQAFIADLNLRSKRHYRLPTEAEWEYAASWPAEKRKARFGNGRAILRPGEANFDASPCSKETYSASGVYRQQTLETGSFAPNELGIYDLAGNVWEWCGDWYDKRYYHMSKNRNPVGPGSGIVRVYRGGSWHDFPEHVRATRRFYTTPGRASDCIGFRLVHPAL